MRDLSNLEPVIFHEKLVLRQFHVLRWDHLCVDCLAEDHYIQTTHDVLSWPFLVIQVVNKILVYPRINLDILQPFIHVGGAIRFAFLELHSHRFADHHRGISQELKLLSGFQVWTDENKAGPRRKELLFSLASTEVFLRALLDANVDFVELHLVPVV